MRNYTIYQHQRAEGIRNQHKPANQINVGEFVYLTGGGFKNCGGPAAYLFDIARGDDNARDVLCKVVEEIEVKGGEFCPVARSRGFWRSRLADCSNLFKNRGGSASDAVEPRELWEYTPEDLETFYSLVTKVTNTDTGHVYFADFEGYAYADEWARKEEERKEREERERAEHLAEVMQDLQAEFHGYDPGKSFKCNLSQMLRDRFGCLFKVCKRSYKWGGEHYIATAAADVDRDEFLRFVDHLREDFRHYTGETRQTHDGYTASVVTNVFFERFGGCSDIELR